MQLYIKNIAKYFIFNAILTIFLFNHGSVMAQNNITFFDDFNSNVIDSSKWEFDINGGNLLLNVDTPNNIHQIHLSSYYNKNYPYIRTKNNIFPLTNNYTLEFRAKFPKITNWGVGLVTTTSSIQNMIPVSDEISSRIFTFHADLSNPNFWFRFKQQIINYNHPVDNEFHIVSIKYTDSVYKYYIDNKNIYNSIETNTRPSFLFFGSPYNQQTLSDKTEWTEFIIDYIKVYTNNIIVPSPTPVLPTATPTKAHTPTPTRKPSPVPTQTPIPTPTKKPTPLPTPTFIPPSPTATIKPTSVINPPDILIFLPGHGACIDLEDITLNTSVKEWKPIPFYNLIYGNLFLSLEKGGYSEKNQNLYNFCYDWRAKTDITSDKLNKYIQDLLKLKPKDTKVTLLAHSYGGLISRNYLQRYYSKNQQLPPVKQILTVGTPHEGVNFAYPAISGGQIALTDVLRRTLFELPLICYGSHYPTRREAIAKIAPSTFDLLPIYDFLKDKNAKTIPSEKMYLQNEWLKNLKNSLSPKEKSLLTIYQGDNLPTHEYFLVQDPGISDNLLGNWRDGKPRDAIFSSSGDETVLLKSNQLNTVLTKTANHSHINLLRSEEALKDVFSLLKINAEPVKYDPESIIENILAIFVFSPAYITVYDNNNKQIGYYLDETKKAILIPNLSTTNYRIEITGTAKGDYLLSTNFISNKDTISSDFSGKTTKNNKDNLIIAYENEKMIVKNKTSKDYINSINSRLEIIWKNISNTNISKTSKNILRKEILFNQKLLKSIANDIDKYKYVTFKEKLKLLVLSNFVLKRTWKIFGAKTDIYYSELSQIENIFGDIAQASKLFQPNLSENQQDYYQLALKSYEKISNDLIVSKAKNLDTKIHALQRMKDYLEKNNQRGSINLLQYEIINQWLQRLDD